MLSLGRPDAGRSIDTVHWIFGDALDSRRRARAGSRRSGSLGLTVVLAVLAPAPDRADGARMSGAAADDRDRRPLALVRRRGRRQRRHARGRARA